MSKLLEMFEVRSNIRSQLIETESNKTVSSYELRFSYEDRFENLNKMSDYFIENFNSNSTTNITNNYKECLKRVK